MVDLEGTNRVLACSHAFGDPDKAHYCNYIQVPGLLRVFYPGAKTVDELLLCSGLYSYTLWWNLQERELAALLQLAEANHPLSPEKCYDAIKRANRCVETGRIMLQQGGILRSELLRRKPNINFRLASAEVNQLEKCQQVAVLTRRLEQRLEAFSLDQAVDAATSEWLLNSLKDLILTHADNFTTLQRDFRDIMWAMHEQPAPRVVPFDRVVPAPQIL